MLSPYKIKWSFIFCNFWYATDRASFKRKMQAAAIDCKFLNSHNLLITSSKVDRAYILKNIPPRAQFQELKVTDKQFSLMQNFIGDFKKEG